MPLVTGAWAAAANAGLETLPAGTGDAYGSCYISTPGATTVATVNVPLPLAGVTTAGPLNNFTHTSPGKLTYAARVTGTFLVNATATVTCSADAKRLVLSIAKNTTVDVGSEIGVTMATGAIATSLNSQAVIELDEGDYVSVYIENTIDAANATGTLCNLTVMQVG